MQMCFVVEVEEVIRREGGGHILGTPKIIHIIAIAHGELRFVEEFYVQVA
jgi:hypothetical protein